MKKLNRKGIQRMIDGGGSSGGGGIDMSTLAGYASQAWVNQNYISIEFFRQMFRLYDGTLTDDPDNEEDIEIMPNDELPEDTDDVNIRAMFGFWTKQYITSLGQGGEGGSGDTGTLAGLLDVQLSSLQPGDTLIYNSTLHKWVNGEGGTNISLTQGTGIRITTSGNNNIIALDTVTGLTAGTYTKVTVDAYGRVTSGANPTTLAGYGITDAIGTGVTWWGRTILNNAVSGDMTGVGSLSATGIISTTSKLVSTVATGTAPMEVTSTTKVTNLNVDMLDGLHAVNIQQDCQHTAYGTNNEEGFVKVAAITISNMYANQPLVFRVTQRGRMCGELTLLFQNTNSTDTYVKQFSYTGNIVAASVVKNNNIWSLYIQKSETYDRIGISLIEKSRYMSDRFTIEWTDVQETPSGTLGTTLWQATCRYYFSNETYLEFDSENNGVHLVGGGLYTDTYVSALGNGTSGGSGDTGTLAGLLDVQLSSLQPGDTLIYNSTLHKWENQTIQQGSGSVTNIAAGTGLTTDTGGAIVTTGTISINSTYQTYISHGQTAYGWGDHSQAGYLTGITGTMVNNALGFTLTGTANQTYDLDDIADNATNISTLQRNFDASGNANSALCLTTQSKSAWGVEYWNAAGKPVTISGSMSNVGNIGFDQSGRNIGSILYFNTTYGTLGVGDTASSSYRLRVYSHTSNSVSYGMMVSGRSFVDGNLGIGTSASGTYRLTVSGLTYLNGNVTIPSGNTLTIGGATLSWDDTNSCLKVSTGFSSDEFISAFGVNSSGGGGGSVSLNTILSELNNVSAGTGVLVRSGANSWSWQPYSGGSGSGDVTWSALANTSDTRQIAASHLNVLNDYALADEVLALTGGTVTGALTVQSIIMQNIDEINGVNNGGVHINYTGEGNVSICTGGGNLSVGYANAYGYKLYVQGSIKITANFNVSDFVISQSGDTYYIGEDDSDIVRKGSWTGGSDIRMKDVYEYTYMDYREVANAPIINFSWKNSKNKKLHLGSIAQYWQSHTPYAVVEGGDGMLSMDYGAIALASAVSVARQTVNLEQRIERLEEENAQLRAEISELKAS